MILLTIYLVGVTLNRDSAAQLMPTLPPYGNKVSESNQPVTIIEDHKPPQLDVVTHQLKEGRNVFKLRVNDDSRIASVYIKYVNEGQLRIQQMVPTWGNLYEALVDIYPPSRIVVVQATDINGNSADKSLQYEVVPSDSMTKIISTFFGDLWTQITTSKTKTSDAAK